MTNKKANVFLGLIALSATLFSSISFCDGGSSSGTRGGGDLYKIIRERAEAPADIENLTSYKNLVARYFEWISAKVNSISDPEIRKAITQMTKNIERPKTRSPQDRNPAVRDVFESSYSLSDTPCLDLERVRKSASSEIGKPGTPICFDHELLIQQKPSEKDLISLIVHEHLVHLLGRIDEKTDVQGTLTHPVMQWVNDHLEQFYYDTRKIPPSCRDVYRFSISFVDIAVPAFLTGMGVYSLVGPHWSGQNAADDAALGTIAVLGALRIARSIRDADHKRKYRQSLKLMDEAASLDPSTDSKKSILYSFYQKLVLNNPDPVLQTKVSLNQFATAILEAEKQNEYCPLNEGPMSPSEIEKWLRNWLSVRSPEIAPEM